MRVGVILYTTQVEWTLIDLNIKLLFKTFHGNKWDKEIELSLSFSESIYTDIFKYLAVNN